MPALVPPALPPGSLHCHRQPTIDGDGLRLRPWQPGDRPAVLAGYADPAIQRWHCRTMTDEEAHAWLVSWPQRWQAESGAGWAVTDSTGVLGQISLRRLDLADGIAEVSYWVLPYARGRRVAVRALTALTTWSFDTGLHRLELNHSTANPASCVVARRAGYPAEGTARREGHHADGWHDTHRHARLRIDPPVAHRPR
ncbi:GNAT family N-acetyltransferase [Verrucosispora sioxanthis]|uniref:GNAT family N-acetyltransferase n=1 Tax=Verrucosispora sioxanthis TaxID=2499994 RepID=A0A6M1LCK9_9ACTN|nr:GNAT family N-acetyltransferase [Verrucosispora sioxanthis]NEE66918.1 GNAT family N-acetyltransferase [Verrucosispora sioxanthis]NGM16028.1 GNAT family N-acetyltransferase [Verrucosispora sioxanthis]